MKFRKYSQKDESKLVELWNKCLTFDNISVERFRAQAILDDNFDDKLTQVAVKTNINTKKNFHINDKTKFNKTTEEEEEIIGFIYATKRKFPYLERGLEPERGWINVIFVDPKYQRLGIGKKLLSTMEEMLKNMGCKNITVAAYSPNYFFWGIDKVNYEGAIKFFENQGYYSLDEHYSMGRNLHGYTLPKNIADKKSEAEKQGYKFINFNYSYTLDLLNFLKNEFGGGWKRNALLAMQKNTAEDVLMLVLDNNNKICGCCNRAIDGNPLRIGPIGIAKEKRNAGIGTVLFSLAMYDMSKKGLYRVFFVTTDAAGRRYYERQGLSLIRTTVEYRKDM